jgi:hypothetical protein
MKECSDFAFAAARRERLAKLNASLQAANLPQIN